MKLENTVENESFFNRIFRRYAAPVILLASAGCGAKEFFWPPSHAQINVESEGAGLRAGAKNEKLKADVAYSQSRSTIEDSKSEIDEQKFTAEFNIKCSDNLTVSPVIGLVDRIVTSPFGDSHLYQNGFPFLAVDVRGSTMGIGESYWRARPFFDATREKTIVGPIDVFKSGIYADAGFEIPMFGVLKPLFSYSKENVDYGTGEINPSELQAGLALSNTSMQENLLYSAGLYTSGMTEDDESVFEEGEWQNTILGDITFCSRFLKDNPLGIHGVYGEVSNVGVHGSIGGDALENKKALSAYFRQIHSLITERGLDSILENRIDDARQNMERSLNAPFFYILGVRWQPSAEEGKDPVPEFYGYLGGTKQFSYGYKLIVGANVGSYFARNSEDLINSRYGGVVGVDFGDQGSYLLTLDHVDYASIKDKDFVGIKAVFKK
jgi:hypothetical protein